MAERGPARGPRRSAAWARAASVAIALLAALPAGAAEPSADPSAALFPADRVLQIRLEMDGADFETLRHETRDDEAGVYGRGCLRHPSPKAYTYFPARMFLDDLDALPVAVRKKGSAGSANSERPGLKIHFARYDKRQRLFGMRKLTLNNDRQDPTLVRQCLGYALYRRAGLAAPRCAFARVRVNDLDLGVYVHVESLDRVFLKRRFGAVGCLWEGEASDFRPGWVRTFEFKEGKRAACGSVLGDLTDILARAADGSLERALASRVDLDAFTTFWALEALLGNRDGYSSAACNFFVHLDPRDGRIRFIPWGIDGIMEDPGRFDGPFPTMVTTYGFLALRLYLLPGWPRRYERRLRALLADLWDEDALWNEAEDMVGLIWPQLSPAQRQALPAALDQLKDFICRRRGVLSRELAFDPPTRGLFLAKPPCRPRPELP